MQKNEIEKIIADLKSIIANCEANPECETCQCNWQHAMNALDIIRITSNPASSKNGKKGGRPAKADVREN